MLSKLKDESVSKVQRQSYSNIAVLDQIEASVTQVLLGKQTQVKLVLCCLLARGHLLIEDQPGMGKTTLAQAIADVLGMQFNRIQFTSDLLPADLLGVSIFNPQERSFSFHQGPIFTQLLLADEINRTTPKTQSALLEAMEEQQVSCEGETRALPEPFFVIATQNPSSHSGTYPLPESQLDRFLMRIELGFPSHDAERIMLQRLSTPAKRAQHLRSKLAMALDVEQLHELQHLASQVMVSEHLLDYVQRIILQTRESSKVQYGLSPRGAIALLSAAKAWALMAHRDYLLPEDVQDVFAAVAGHRLSATSSVSTGQALAAHILSKVDVVFK